MMIRCSLLYLHSDCSSCPMIGNSLRATLAPERTLPFSSTTRGARICHIHSPIFVYNSRSLLAVFIVSYLQLEVPRSPYLIHLQLKCNWDVIHQIQLFSRYVTPLLANLKRGNGEEISEGDVHLATGTLDTNTFEVGLGTSLSSWIWGFWRYLFWFRNITIWFYLSLISSPPERWKWPGLMTRSCPSAELSTHRWFNCCFFFF